MAASSFGPRLQAAITTLSVRNRVSRSDAVELTEELFGARISSGTVDAILTRMARALAEPHADLLQQLRAAAALNVDETGWRTAGQRRALWGLFDSTRAYFQVASDRHEDRAKELLADTKAIVTSDRWWAYAHLPPHRRQLCWSHLKRDFQAHAEGLAAEKEFGEAGLALCERVFWAWEVFQHTGERDELQRTVRALQRTYKPIIRAFAAKRARNKRCRGMARNLLKAWPALWTFAAHRGVHPTNNHAERGLRGAVIYRKLSLGSQAQGGERRIERLLSAHTPPAAYSAARYSPTSPTRSLPTPAATQYHYSPEQQPTERLHFCTHLQGICRAPDSSIPRAVFVGCACLAIGAAAPMSVCGWAASARLRRREGRPGRRSPPLEKSRRRLIKP